MNTNHDDDGAPAATLGPDDERDLVAALRQRMIARLADELMPSVISLNGYRPDDTIAALVNFLPTFGAGQVRAALVTEMERRAERIARQEAQDAAMANREAIKARQRKRWEAAKDAREEPALAGFDWWLRAEQKKILEPAWHAHVKARREAGDTYCSVTLSQFTLSQEGRDLLARAELQNL